MRSSASSLSRFLSITSVALASLLGGACSGGGSDCGTGGADATLDATVGGQTITYETLTSLAGNDCPDTVTPAPTGVVSLSIEGLVATGGADGRITFCIPRPDKGDGDHAISKTDPFGIRLEDLTAKISPNSVECDYHLDTANPPTGTAVGSGICDGGENAAGFALDITASGTLVGQPTNPPTCMASVPLSIQGTVAVTKRM
ncbi:MAG TPA: hypothetical protein VGM90_34970 [Kofleriaceae bacterium]|jgi:hypothetical protein